MDTDDSVERTLVLQRSLEKFINTVDELRNEDDPSGDGFTREFRSIREHGIRMKEENTYPTEEGRKSCNVKKNRYRDILPFDETRVKLEEIPNEEGSDYINANFIRNHIGKEDYIASQGPLTHTVVDFWRMIMQYNVKVIAMACQTVEMGRKKCEQYWPSEDAENETEKYGDVTVTLVSEQELSENCVKRVLRAVKGSKDQTVTQFHYTYWPDHDIPKDFEAILEMMAEMRQIRAEDPDNSPMLVHCSAGCGRTGTIVAIDYSWEMLRTGCLTEEFCLYDIVMEMRTQRQSMIQAPEQYMMAHVIIQQLFQKHLEMMEDHTYGNVEFQNEESMGEDTSSISSEKLNQRKNSSLLQEIDLTLKNVSRDDSSSIDSKSLTQEHITAPPQVSPVQEETEEPIKSPDVKQMAAKFNIEKIENIPPVKQTPVQQTSLKQTLKSQTSLTSDGRRKHVTTIAIGGTASKQPVIHTQSQPVGPTTTTTGNNVNRAKTLPNVKEKPQSSIPPTPPTQSKDVYSYATNDVIPKSTDSSYSTIASYSSVKQNNGNLAPVYHVLEKPGESTLNNSRTDGNQPGGAYSFAKEPEPLYTAVKPKMNGVQKQNGTTGDDVYEAVQVEQTTPPIPNRGYLEEDSEKPSKPPLGAGDSQSQGKTKQFMSNFKNMFTAKSHSSHDGSSPSEIPGFKEKIGGKPVGPREPPWKKK